MRDHPPPRACAIGIYNLVRKHLSLDGQTPAQAAGIEEKRWDLEDVDNLTDASWQPKYAARAAKKAAAKRIAEDAEFSQALAEIEEAGL